MRTKNVKNYHSDNFDFLHENSLMFVVLSGRSQRLEGDFGVLF